MYEVVFRCSKCRCHLSASADDAGYEFNCPNCGHALSVPAGDILFSCDNCQVSVLASADAVGEHFECPRCQSHIVVPAQGKHVEVAEHAAPTTEPINEVAQVPASQESAQEQPSPQDPATLQNTQFMTTWGDYLAAAKLTDDDDTKKQKK